MGRRAGDNPRCLSVAENQHLRQRERVGMRDGDERGSAAHGGEPARGAPVQPQLRWTAVSHDLDVAPQDAVRVAGSQGLHGGFLGRESAGKVRRRHAAPHAVGHFALGEDTMGESLAVALDGGGDTGDVGGVKPESDDVHAPQA